MILITGCARSGTSLTTAVLRACGATLGGGRINQLNEALDVRDGVTKPWLEARGYDPMGQGPLPPGDGSYDLDEPEEFRAKVLAALRGPEEPWAYKGAKMCLFWRQWAAAFPEARWVIVRRERERIIDSCVRTSFMRRYRTREGWGQWVDFHLDRFVELDAALETREVWPSGEPEAFRGVVEWCGLEYDEAAVAGVIDPGRWRG